MAVQLTHFEAVEKDGIETIMEIIVGYNFKDYEVEELRYVYICNDRQERETGDLLPFLNEVSELSVAIEKIVDRVDWRELYLHP